MLHYDLSFLNVNEAWCPKNDKKRFDDYKFLKDLFELTPEDVVRDIVPKGLTDFGNHTDLLKGVRLLGYQRLLTLKTTDMVMGQPPKISVQADDKGTEVIKDLSFATLFNYHLKQALIDYSRFGVLLIRVFKDERGHPALAVWDPCEWIPVFYPDGTKRIRYNVIGWTYKNKLTVQIHDTSDGSYEERVMQVDDSGVILRVISSKIINKGKGKPLFFAIPNTPTSTNPLGTSDYIIINGLVQKAVERLRAILRVLDEHADPSMTGPHTLLSKAEGSNELVFKTSKFYAVGQDEKEPKYLTWEANLESSFKAFNTLMKEIYTLSEMGEAFLGTAGGTGNVVSGTAMRLKMISPLEKARRIQNDLNEPLKKVISSMLSIEGIDVEAHNINISWRDSLPKDPRETAELAKLEAGSVSIKPLVNAIMDNFDLDRETAEKYVEEITKDQESFAAVKADGRTIPVEGPVDPRKKGSVLDPASSENRGDDENAGLT